MDHQFRNAALGGFHKQDVLDYLELTAREHKEQTDALQAQLEQLQARCASLEEQSALANHQQEEKSALADRLQEENTQLKVTVTQLQQQLAASQNESELLRARAEQDAHSCRQLQQQIDKLGPDAAAYAAVKERTAGVELEAHRRAQAIVDEAQVQAEQVRRELGQWLERVERDYYDLRAQVGTTVTQAASELERVRLGLDNITLCMNNQHSALDRLMQTAKNIPNGNE